MKIFIIALLLAIGYAQTEEKDDADPGFWYTAEGHEHYYEARDGCKWSEPISAPEFWGDSFLYTSSNAFNQFWYDAGRDKLKVTECYAPAPDRQGEIWVIRRVGPYNTTGGAKEGEWHATKFHENNGHRRWITGRFSGRVDANGKLFPSPPLHIHHEHYAYQETLPSYVRATKEMLGTYTASRIYALHGDNYFMDAEGGVIGNAFKSYPEGYAKRMKKTYYFDNRIGDIRPPGSPVLQWYTEIAYRFTLERPKNEILHMTRFNTANFFENFHIHVPKESPSLFWQAWRMPADGRMETNWCHTHGAEHIIVFKGDPNRFALGQKYKKHDIWTPLHVKNVDDVAEELKQSATDNGVEYCEGKIQWEGEEIRMTKINCKPWIFKEGDIAAMISLYDPVARPYTNLMQHFIFRGDWIPDDPMAADKRPELLMQNFYICGEDPDHCIISMSLGFKVYLAIITMGWMPEYYAAKAFVGWCIVLGLLGLISYGCYRLLAFLYKRRSKYMPLSGVDSILPSLSSIRSIRAISGLRNKVKSSPRVVSPRVYADLSEGDESVRLVINDRSSELSRRSISGRL